MTSGMWRHGNKNEGPIESRIDQSQGRGPSTWHEDLDVDKEVVLGN